MKQELQQIAIAEAIGITPHPDNDHRPLKDKFWCRQYGGDAVGPVYTLYGGYGGSGDVGFWDSAKPLPNFPQDLNAMHEAEKFIKNTDSWRQYKYELNLMLIDEIHATAEEKAEAFLKALNLWIP